MTLACSTEEQTLCPNSQQYSTILINRMNSHSIELALRIANARRVSVISYAPWSPMGIFNVKTPLLIRVIVILIEKYGMPSK